MQSIRITSRPLSRIRKRNQFNQFRWINSDTYKKDFSWLHLDNETRVQESQQVKDQQSCISVSVFYPTIPSSNQEHQPNHNNCSIHGRFIEIQSNLMRKKLHRTNQGSNFLGGIFGNIDNVRAQIQFRR